MDLGSISFSVGADGSPYATYMVGADTVIKKLGRQSWINVGTNLKFLTTASDSDNMQTHTKTFNVSALTSDFSKLTVNDFFVDIVGIEVFRREPGERKVQVSGTLKKSLSYNNTTGVLTVAINFYSVTQTLAVSAIANIKCLL